MSPEERQTWRMTGTLPNLSDAPDVDAQTSTEADSSPAKPVEQAASTDASTPPASETGTPKKNTAETRKAELNAEIKAMLAEIDTLKATRESLRARPSADTDVNAAPSPAPQSASLEAVITAPDLSRPMLKDAEFYERFPDASITDFMRYTARYEFGAVEQAKSAQQAQRSRVEFYNKAITKAVDEFPNLESRVPTVLRDVAPVELLKPGEAAGPLNYAMQEIWNSDKAGQLLIHIADHPDVLTKIQQSRSAAETIRTIAQLEARLETASVSPPAPAGNPVSLAAPPPSTLGKKPAQPADELTDAIRTGDFARYRELQNQKELKRA